MRDSDDHDLEAAAVPTMPSSPAVESDIGSLDELERFRDEIAAQFDARELELNRRERALGEQLTALDRERRNSRLTGQSHEQKAQQRESALVAKEADFSLRLARCEELIAELEDEQATLDVERAGLSEQKQAIRETVLAELAEDRRAIDSERESLYAEKRELRRRIEHHEQETASARGELRQSWEAERESLRKQLTAKLAAELLADRRAFDDERAAWEDRRREEQAAFEQERSEHDRHLDRAKSDLERLRREQEIEFARRRRELEAEIESQVRGAEATLHQQQAEWEAARAAAESELRDLRIEQNGRRAAEENSLAIAREEFEQYREEQLAEIAAEAKSQRKAVEAERLEWVAEREADSERLAKEEAALEAARQELDAEQQRRRERVTAELAAMRQQHEREIAAERDALDRECEAVRLALDEERAVTENRLHFQKEHLDRTRDELERARRELEQRLQKGRSQAASLGEQLRLRQTQLLRFRRLLDEREAVIDRERALFAELRQQADDERRRSATQRDADDEAWLREKESEQLGLHHLRDELAARSDQLATRQARLDTLRVELETTHRENLELRVALDETWAKLSQAAGPEKARQQLQETRLLVAEHFRRQEAELDRRRALVSQDATGARKLLDQLDVRRRDLSDWLSESLSALHRREEELKRWATTLDARESRSVTTVARWREEQAEAECVIRGLLRQLTDAVASESTPPGIVDDGERVAVNPPQGRLAGPHLRPTVRENVETELAADGMN
ncbi:MAG: hypothetical protein WBC44_17210 [Planctomycetaceae bacterium]